MKSRFPDVSGKSTVLLHLGVLVMARPKRTFNVGVFGIPARIIYDVVRIKVNVRTDQDYQRTLAKLPEDSTYFWLIAPAVQLVPQTIWDSTKLWLVKSLKRLVDAQSSKTATSVSHLNT